MLLVGMGAFVFSSGAFGAITYVDATDGAAGNTALAAGGVWTPPIDPAATGTDNLWRKRTGLANGSTVYEASGQGTPTDDAQRLVTTISGLNPGEQYSLYVFFWSPNDNVQQWLLRTNLTNPGAGDLPSWSRLYNDAVNNPTGVVLATGSGVITTDNIAPFPAMGPADFTNPGSLVATTSVQGGKTVINDGNRFLWAAPVGIAAANGSGQAQVFIDDYVLAGLGATDSVNHRSWFDGVGFGPVPEPASLGLLATAALGLLGRRKRA